MKKLTFLLLITRLILSQNLFSEEIKTVQAKEIWTIEEGGGCPYLSPDGKYVAWYESVSGEKVYLAKVGTKKVIKLGKTKELLGWAPGNNEYLMTAEGFLSVKTKKRVSLLPGMKNGFIKNILSRDFFNVEVNKLTKIITPFWAIQEGKIVKSFCSENPYNIILFQDIQQDKAILFFNGSPIWENNRGGKIFSVLPVLGGKKLYIRLFAIQPNLKNLVVEKDGKWYSLPEGTHFSWSSDGKQLIFARLKDDGHFFTEGELFLCNWDGTNIRHIKFEKKRIRYNPSFGPPDMITYIFDDENHKPCIGVAKLLLQMKHKQRESDSI